MGVRWSWTRRGDLIRVSGDESYAAYGDKKKQRLDGALSGARENGASAEKNKAVGSLIDSLRGVLKGDYSDADGRDARTEKYRAPAK